MRWWSTRWLIVAMLGLGLVAVGCNSSSDEPPAPLASPSDLESFRYDLNAKISGGGGDLGGGSGVNLSIDFTVDASGAIVAPDRQQSTIKADLGFLSINLESISIGEDSWTREPGGEWTTASEGGFGDLGFDVSPTDVLPTEDDQTLSDLRDILADREWESEEVNGIDAVRYDITREDLVAMVTETGTAQDLADLEDMQEFDGSIWLERSTGIPVKLLVDASGTVDGEENTIHLELNLKDLNDDSIEIEPPA
ncbi:MAG: hypothetical protein R3C39_00325 [Dehalococcoidia bacterium]